jgi:hypothetical protein
MTSKSRVEGRRPLSVMIIERESVSRPATAGPWMKLVAIAIVGIMVLTGFAVFGQAVHKSAPAPAAEEQPEPAKTLAGSREATYTIDHMFELYQKSHDPAALGRWNGSMGLNGWWSLRETLYQEYPARTSYPYVLVSNPYSSQTTPDIDQGGSITTWYRQTVDAKNLTAIAAGPDLDPIFTPVLGPTSTAGAYMNISWYGTYLETWELAAIRAGTHYANTYYDVPAGLTPREVTNDGYYHELQGKLTFNRAAASKILGLSALVDLRVQFTANDDAITIAWFNDWTVEGGPGGAFDIYTEYDYSLSIQWLELSLDPTSTADSLVLRFWSVSWGNEFLLIRYMEAANVMKYWQGWSDDWYLNITIGPDGGNVHSRAVIGSHMYATKDSINNINGWALEGTHVDWCGNSGPHQSYVSPYTYYDPKWTDATHVSWAPLTVNFAKPVSYARSPLHWNLTAGEKFIVKLPSASTSMIGYTPKASTSDILGATKIAEMAANMNWGEMVMGNGYPNSGTNNLKNFYNPTTKTITLVGPLNFAKNWNPAFPNLLETGAPMFKLDVAKVGEYSLEIVGDTPPYDDLVPGTPYTLRVTAKNVTGITVTDWTGTVDLTSSNIVLAEVSHMFVASDLGVWQTTFQLVDYGDFSIVARDRTFPLDVAGVIGTTPPNTPPTAEFTVTPPTGDTNAVYSFDASYCSDAEDPIQALEVRWDWTSDGVFDTGWGASKIATHVYAMPGECTVTLEVRDTGGLTADASHSVVVNPPVPPPVTIIKTSKTASNPVVWYYQPIVSGAYSVKIVNTGFKSMVIEIYDETGSSTRVFRQTIKFSSYGAYPTGTAISDQCALIANHNYKIVVKDYDGAKGSKAVVYSLYSWSP